MPEDDAKRGAPDTAVDALDRTMDAPGGAPAPQVASPGVGGPQRKQSMPPIGPGFDQTLAGARTLAEDASPSSATTSQPSTVGQELRGASIERFGRVERDRFEILGELARGGLGRVMSARDPRTGRTVALKEVLYATPELLTRFAREAMVTANLQHPAIVPVYEVGRWSSGEPFYAMKLVRGRTLDSLIAEAKAPAARVQLLPHVIAIADALAYAHGEHVIHRDLKPANILVGDYGETVVIDWGLARNLTVDEDVAQLPIATTIPPDSGETMLGAIVGTPAYMPPEQALGERVDERADVYAIGAILYHVLGGTRPFADAKSVDELLERVAYGAPKPLAELAPDAPPELLAITAKAMARAREARYATAAGLAADLRRFQAGQLVGALQYTSWQLVRRWFERNRTLVYVAGGALVVLIAVIGFSVYQIAGERDEALAQRARAEQETAAESRANAIAQSRFAESLDELARQAATSGGPDRALVFAAAAFNVKPTGADTPLMRVLAGEARASYTGLVTEVAAGPTAIDEAELSPDGTRLYELLDDGVLVAVALPDGHELWRATATDLRVASISHDGTRYVGLRADGSVIAGDTATGAQSASWPGIAAPEQIAPRSGTSINLSPDGARWVAVAGGTVTLGAMTPGSPIAHAAAHPKPVYAATFSPDGALLAVAGNEGTTTISDAATGATRAQLVDAGDATDSVVWLDADHVITGGAKGIAHEWQVSARRVVRTFAHGAEIYGSFAGDHWLVTYGEGANVSLWDLDSGERRAVLGGHHLATDSVATDGRWLVTTDEGGNAYRWDPATGIRVQAIPPVGQSIGVVGRAPWFALTGEGPARVYRFDAPGVAGASADRLRPYTVHTARVRDLQVERGLVWTASNDGSALAIDPATGAVKLALGTGGFPEPPVIAVGPTPPSTLNPHGARSIRFSEDGALAAVGNEDGTIAIYDAHAGTLRATWRGHTGRARSVVFTGKVAYSVGHDGTLRRWDVATGTEQAHAELGAPLWDVLAFPDGKVLAVLTDANQVRLVRAADLAPLAFTTPSHAMRLVDDKLLVASDSQIMLVDEAGTITQRANQSGGFSGAASDSLIALGDSHDFVSLFDRKLALVRQWHLPQGELPLDLAFSPDGKLLATASVTHVRLWDVASGRLLAERDLTDVILALRWLPDGGTLAIVGGGHAVIFWDLRGGDPATLSELARCVAPWALSDTSLVAAPIAPGACALSSPQ
ncbi:MAG TPA: protein kinase [Kofleriaceae bacterium]